MFQVSLRKAKEFSALMDCFLFTFFLVSVVVDAAGYNGRASKIGDKLMQGRVFNDLIDNFTKSDSKSFWDDFEIFKIPLKYGDLI
jgi:hypothetical protein